MQFYFKAQSQHGHSMLQLAVELARIRSFFGDAPYLITTLPFLFMAATGLCSSQAAGRVPSPPQIPLWRTRCMGYGCCMKICRP